MTADTTALQAEISRQQVIIALLVEKNQLLERQLAYANSRIEALKNHTNSQTNTDEFHAMLTQNQNNTAQARAMLNQENSDIAQDHANPVQPLSNIELSRAMLTQSQSNIAQGLEAPLLLHNGISMALSPDVNIGTPLKAFETPHQLNPTRPGDQAELAKLAAAIDPAALYRAMKDSYKGVRFTAVYNMAVLLHHLLKEPKNTHRQLGRVLEFSDRGVYMLLQTCMKRGLIQRTGYQQFALTETALGFVWEARHRK